MVMNIIEVELGLLSVVTTAVGFICGDYYKPDSVITKIERGFHSV